MVVKRSRVVLVVLAVLALGIWYAQNLRSQEPASSGTKEDMPPAEPKGVEVMARGPIHEAFAAPTTEPVATKPLAKRPPKPITEVPPEEKPEGNAVWIGGYWGWDDDRSDYLWISGVWRVPPPNKQWVAGYWREDGDNWQWVSGFWTDLAKNEEKGKDVTYLPTPPKPPQVAAPAKAPNAESFYVPGSWVWNGEDYAWRAGYWARVQPGYIWVAAHYQWTPSGYVYVPGYWDVTIARRGFMYAPVVVDVDLVGPTFVYTPRYVVRDVVVMDAMFVRPACSHYYFGDYYGVRYERMGYVSTVVYSRRYYDPIVVYAVYEHRSEPAWLTVQVNLYGRRCRGEVACPPRTLVQQNTIIQQNITNVTINNINRTTVVNNNTVLVPASKLAAEKKIQMVKLDNRARYNALQTSRAVQQASVTRGKMEVANRGIPSKPRTMAMKVQPVQQVRTPVAPRPNTNTLGNRGRGTSINPRTNPTGRSPYGTNPPRGGRPNPNNRYGPQPRYGSPNGTQPNRNGNPLLRPNGLVPKSTNPPPRSTQGTNRGSDKDKRKPNQ